MRSLDRVALKDVAPILLGLIPFAMVLGIAMSEASIGTGTGVFGSLLVFAGSAQLAAVGLMTTGAGIVAILATVLAINARMLIYGAAMEPLFRPQPTWFRWVAPQFMVDQNFALATSRQELRDPARFRRYWLTVSAAIGIVWLLTVAATMSFGAMLPESSPLEFASVTVFVGLLVPRLISDRRARRAAAIAAVVAAAGIALPQGIGLVMGIAAGAVLPVLLEGRAS